MRRALFATALLLSACGGSGRDVGAQRLPTVRVVLTQAATQLVVIAEVADDPKERSIGLMFRPTIPTGTGMLFAYPAPIRRSFHMKNTLVELHVLFIRAGKVVEIRNMRPCTTDPCPLTTPRQDYDAALEVGIGTLGLLQVGARVEIFGSLPQPV